MANQYSSEKKTLGLLLSLTSPPIEVPDWQRDYSWDTSAVDTFWQDLCAFSNQYPGPTITDQEYFLGSIVLVNTPTKQLLLDGQQRLATATILLSVIRDFLGKHTQDAATRTSQKYITDFNDATGAYTFKLTLNRIAAKITGRSAAGPWAFPLVEALSTTLFVPAIPTWGPCVP